MLRLIGSLLVSAYLVHTQHVVLNTTLGTVRGTIEKSRTGRPFFAFYTIPYAEPPLGELRFESPRPPKPWKGEKDCTQLPPACLSIERGLIYGQEDCLYLNIYTPKLISDSPLPVMVFIHGGVFMYQNALPGQFGPHFFMDKDVLLVTFHYRLGALGFLSTEDEHLPGNYGLKDFAAALRWIQANIHSFNGDKNRVTVFGGSSGGCTSGFAFMSPLTKGLFHGSISQSGFPVYGILPRGVARKRAWKIAENVGCASGDSKDLRSCLKQVSAVELIQALPPIVLGITEDDSISVPNNDTIQVTFPFGAVIEDEKSPGAFLVDTPEVLLSRKSDIPWIVGITSDEGGMAALFAYFEDEKRAQVLAENYHIYFPLLFDFADNFREAAKLKEVADRMRERYFGDTDIKKNPIGFAKMMNLYYLPVMKKSLDIYRGPKYVYYYDHRNENTYSNFYASYPPDLDFGVVHGDEFTSLFNATEKWPPVTKGIDLIVSEQMIELWTNFAAFGYCRAAPQRRWTYLQVERDPNGMGKRIWPVCNSSRIEHLYIGNGELKMREELLKDEFDFLNELTSLVSKIKSLN